LKTQLSAKETVLDSNKELQKQMQATIDSLTLTEEANDRTIQELRNKQKQLIETIYKQTKTEDTTNPTIQELLDKQTKQIVEALKQTVPCLVVQQKDVSTRKVEAITTSK
jgi:uncharacterized protein involved in exopolysaccharide biosynthesis